MLVISIKKRRNNTFKQLLTIGYLVFNMAKEISPLARGKSKADISTSKIMNLRILPQKLR